jgi:predicted nucleic acid-binding protein
VIVADASVIVEFLLGGLRGRAVEDHLLANQHRIHAPALIDAEVLQTLRRLVQRREMGGRRGLASVGILQAFPLARHDLTPLLPRIWALRDNLTAYDAAYVALAEALDCQLLTFDRRLSDAPGITARVVIPVEA